MHFSSYFFILVVLLGLSYAVPIAQPAEDYSPTISWEGTWTDSGPSGYGMNLYICQKADNRIFGIYSFAGLIVGCVNGTEAAGHFYEGGGIERQNSKGTHRCITGTFHWKINFDSTGTTFNGSFNCIDVETGRIHHTWHDWGTQSLVSVAAPSIIQCGALATRDVVPHYCTGWNTTFHDFFSSSSSSSTSSTSSSTSTSTSSSTSTSTSTLTSPSTSYSTYDYGYSTTWTPETASYDTSTYDGGSSHRPNLLNARWQPLNNNTVQLSSPYDICVRDDAATGITDKYYVASFARLGQPAYEQGLVLQLGLVGTGFYAFDPSTNLHGTSLVFVLEDGSLGNIWFQLDNASSPYDFTTYGKRSYDIYLKDTTARVPSYRQCTRNKDVNDDYNDSLGGGWDSSALDLVPSLSLVFICLVLYLLL